MIVVRPLLLALCLILAGCSNVIAGTPEKQHRGTASGGPIQPAQLDQLLTPSSSLSILASAPLSEHDLQSALFIGADPPECHGVVGFGRFPLFPTNYTGREARTQVDIDGPNQHQLLEVSATYPSDFNASAFLDSVRKTVDECQRPVTTWGDDQKRYTVNPAPLIPDSPDIAHWSTKLAGERWICDFSLVALANVASEIVTCSADRSIDNKALASKRLKKIEELLNSTA
ncbi:sensor domain-containing protein [Mycobacterium fragae]|uniref:sensor domain-containing protein n=1 Tax=Mycobacterium fragae TaxID=1260918 RepID=UPI00268C5B89